MSTLERYPVSVAIRDAISQAGFPVGLAIKPEEGGWVQGSPPGPGSTFAPYAVLVPNGASVSSGPVSDSNADWRLPYTVTAYGVTGEQAERLADRCRLAVAGIVKTTISVTTGSYKVQKVGLSTIGQVTRQDQTEPPFYTQTDTIEVWLSREFT
jgi:hypothetical protein